MTLKEFGENAEVAIRVTIYVNDNVATEFETFSIDSAIDRLGSAERNNLIGKAIEEQYQDLPEPIEDESRGYDD